MQAQFLLLWYSSGSLRGGMRGNTVPIVKNLPECMESWNGIPIVKSIEERM